MWWNSRCGQLKSANFGEPNVSNDVAPPLKRRVYSCRNKVEIGRPIDRAAAIHDVLGEDSQGSSLAYPTWFGLSLQSLHQKVVMGDDVQL